VSENKKIVAGFTTSPDTFLELGVKAREEGFEDLDCFMPYPVHGFDEAYGLKGSWIGIAAFIMLVVGWCVGVGLQTFMMKVDYPVNIGGKPFFAWPSFIPVTFECGILFAGLTTLLSLLFICKLRPDPFKRVLKSRLTDDLFAILIPVSGDADEKKALDFLAKEDLEKVETITDKEVNPSCLVEEAIS
jgi:hypothetical protein